MVPSSGDQLSTNGSKCRASNQLTDTTGFFALALSMVPEKSCSS